MRVASLPLRQGEGESRPGRRHHTQACTGRSQRRRERGAAAGGPATRGVVRKTTGRGGARLIAHPQQPSEIAREQLRPQGGSTEEEAHTGWCRSQVLLRAQGRKGGVYRGRACEAQHERRFTQGAPGLLPGEKAGEGREEGEGVRGQEGSCPRRAAAAWQRRGRGGVSERQPGDGGESAAGCRSCATTTAETCQARGGLTRPAL